MQPAALRCPNCGAPISPPISKCGYCGAHLTFQKDILSFSSTIACPRCKTQLADGSFICVHCGNILATDSETTNIIKTQQKRIKFLQDKRRNSIPFDLVQENLESTEFIYYTIGEQKLGWGMTIYKGFQLVVTDKRIIVYDKRKLDDIPYENIVTISQPIDISGGIYKVEIVTYEKGDRSFTFPDFSSAHGFFEMANLAHENCIFKKKDIAVTLCFASI